MFHKFDNQIHNTQNNESYPSQHENLIWPINMAFYSNSLPTPGPNIKTEKPRIFNMDVLFGRSHCTVVN